MNFYKHFIGDFQRDTGHLSLTERGAYLALIHHYYATEIPLPNNLDSLCRIAGAVSSIERKAVKSIIAFFEVVDSGLMHNRIEAEIHKAGEISNTNRDIALAREEKRRAEKLAKLEHVNSTFRAKSVARTEHEQSTNQTPDTRHHINQELKHTEETLTIPKINELGRVCLAIKSNGIIDINPSNPTFTALLEAGATVDEFTNAAIQAVNAGKPKFSYLLGIVKNQREAAAKLILHKGALPAMNSREAGRQVAAKSIFTDTAAAHLRQPKSPNHTELEVIEHAKLN